MIARYWSARARRDTAPHYARHFDEHVLPALRSVPGYAAGTLLQREAGEEVEIVVITWWQSLDSIRAFAGGNLDTAVVADEAAALFVQYDRRVRHYNVVAQDGMR